VQLAVVVMAAVVMVVPVADAVDLRVTRVVVVTTGVSLMVAPLVVRSLAMVMGAMAMVVLM
jgi:hypothetical protein